MDTAWRDADILEPASRSSDSTTVSVQQYLLSTESGIQPHRSHRSVSRWLPEIIASVVSLCCLVAIVTVLAVYDQNEPPNWPLGITLNVFLATFTSIAKLGIVVPVMEGLGQLCWLWFSKNQRSLADFELYDRASRGASGSLKLMFSLKGNVLVYLGCILSVVSLFTSPITQQVIQYPSRTSAIAGTASVARSPALGPIMPNFGNWIEAMDNLEYFKQNLLAGAYTPPWESVDYLAPVCSSGECSFPDFVSAGICTTAVDISDRLNITRLADRDWHFVGLDDNTTWSIGLLDEEQEEIMPMVVPNVLSFNLYSRRRRRRNDVTAMDSPLLAAGPRNLNIADMVLIYGNAPATPGRANSTFGAIEVLFYLCTKAFSLSVYHGVVNFTEAGSAANPLSNDVDTFNMLSSAKFQGCMLVMDSTSSATPCPQTRWGNVTLAPPRGFESHPPVVIDESAGLAVSAMLQTSLWSGAAPFLGGASAANDPVAGQEGGMYMFGATYYRILGDLSAAIGIALFRSNDPAVQLEVIGNMSRNMGIAMENDIRAHFKSPAGATVNDTLHGTVFGQTPYVYIRWSWLTFLVAELALTAVFLAAVVVVTHRARLQVIKSSALATLCALDNPTRRHLAGINDPALLEDQARTVDVRLEKSVSGLALWLTMLKPG